MKNRIYMFALLVASLVMGCIDDKGNYDYVPVDELFPVAISGLKDEVDVLVGEELKLTATVQGDEQLENLRYAWFLNAGTGMRDTLGYGKELNYKVELESATYTLLFEVKDTVKEVFVRHEMKLAVQTVYSKGWLVMESDGTGSDVDFVSVDGEVRENQFTATGSGRMPGEPRQIFYWKNHNHEVDYGDSVVVEKKEAFLFLSEHDMRVCNANNMEVLKRGVECFYEAPEVLEPRCVVGKGGSAVHLNNAGMSYYLPDNGANIGKFGYPPMGPDGTYNYDMHRDMFYGSQYTVAWDQESHSFVYADFNNTPLSYFNASTGEDYGPVSNMDKELVRLLYRYYVYNKTTYQYTYYSYAVMKDPDGKIVIADVSSSKLVYPLAGYYDVPEGGKLGEAEVMAVHESSPKVFFSAGNELWEHNVNFATDLSVRERIVYTFPGEEKIAFMQHVDDDLVVLTNSAAGWNLYAFPFIGGGSEFDGSVSPEKVLIARGEGQGRYVLKR
ncbi:MAG TPA: hypothetical protein K8V05_03850 [Butyricimonas virosa]|uniref:Uncharacterized protein n=1 Tax=Butyricimonas virosa TaxID=544645 RepID=A0A921H349_9BACT|nr:hypothetical protein [Butyricimonas virosa]